MQKKFSILLFSSLLLSACDSNSSQDSPSDAQSHLTGITETIEQGNLRPGQTTKLDANAAIDSDANTLQGMGLKAGSDKQYTLHLHHQDSALSVDQSSCTVSQSSPKCTFEIKVPENDEKGDKDFWITSGQVESNHAQLHVSAKQVDGQFLLKAHIPDGVTPKEQPAYQVINPDNGQVVKKGQVQPGKAITVDHIKTDESGRTYQLELLPFTSTDGQKYVVDQKKSITVKPNETRAISVDYHKDQGHHQSQASIEVTLPKRPTGVSADQKADVIIYQGETQVAQVNQADWGQTKSVAVDFKGSEAKFQVQVNALGDVKGHADPSNFTLHDNDDQKVKIDYDAPAPVMEGDLSIRASVQGSSPSSQPTYEVKDPDNHVVKQGQLSFSHAIDLTDLPTTQSGQPYTVEAKDFTSGGYLYKTDNQKTVTIENGKTSTVSFDYQAESLPSESVSLKVSGLPEGQSSTITLSSDDASNDTRIIQADADQTYQVDVPQDGRTWHIKASSINDYYASVNPLAFKADQQQQGIEIHYQQHQDHQWPDKVVVGYVRGYDAEWKSQPDTTNKMIETAMDRGYNVIAYAFGGQKQDGQVYLPKFTDAMKASIPDQLDIIHQHGGYALLSIGGAENFFTPDMSGQKGIDAGHKMGQFLADHDYDGIDIDVEHPTSSMSKDGNFLRYLKAARQTYQDQTGKALFVTAAPQISGYYGTGKWASGSASFAERIYSQKFMNQAHLDAVFIQTYNQYGGAKFAKHQGWDVGFLTYTFNLLSPEMRDDMKGVYSGAFYVPEETKIVLGVPDYKAPYIEDNDDENNEYHSGACLADASCSGVGLYDPDDINQDILRFQNNLNDYPQYGGVMTWILNSDAYQGWSWVDGIMPSIGQ